MSVENDLSETIRDLGESTSRQRERVIWLPAVANGGAILIIGQIVATAGDQDAALRALSIPLSVFACGVAAAAAQLFDSESVKKERKLFLRMRSLMRQANSAAEADQTAPGSSDAKLKFAKSLQAGGKLLEDMKAEKFNSEHCRKASFICFAVSITFSVAGFAALLAGHAAGVIVLDPRQGSRPISGCHEVCQMVIQGG